MVTWQYRRRLLLPACIPASSCLRVHRVPTWEQMCLYHAHFASRYFMNAASAAELEWRRFRRWLLGTQRLDENVAARVRETESAEHFVLACKSQLTQQDTQVLPRLAQWRTETHDDHDVSVPVNQW